MNDLPLKRRAVFLDRDGVLNVYLPGDYVKSPKELILLRGAAEAVRLLNDANLPVYIISNQQGVARGVMTEADLEAVDHALHAGVSAEGGRIERSYYCTAPSSANHPDRKPGPGMILRAAAEHHLDLAASMFIGDTETDAEAARAAGVGHFVLVLTGKHSHSAAGEDISLFPVRPDYIAPDLKAAAEWITKSLFLGSGDDE